MTTSWKRTLPALGLGIALGLGLSRIRLDTPTVSAQETESPRAEPGTVLADLLEGNKRFVEGKAAHPHADQARIAELAKGQHPRAVVLACADSRVAPEIVFDQGLGDIFTIRVAGNTLDATIVGSVEYAVEHLGSSLVLVMGHARCGAVRTTLDVYGKPDALVALGPNLEALVERIAPIVPALPAGLEGEARIEAAVEANAAFVAHQLEAQSEIVHHAVESKKATVIAGVYDLAHGGKVTILEKSEKK
jgi:carbonic anhydrase